LTDLAKATLERSFRSVKDALAPLVRLTARVADAVPALRRADFAVAVARVLVGTFLAVDLAARRSTLGTGPAPHPDAFAALAEQAREKARADDRSRKLTLVRIHEEYDMPGSRADFVRRLRRHRVEDLLEAERRMGRYACRCHAKLCDRYFASIVRRVHREQGAERAAERQRTIANVARRQATAQLVAQLAQRNEQPDEWVVNGLERVAAQWCTSAAGFVLGRSDPLRGELRRACARLVESDALRARDRAEVAWRRWDSSRTDLDDTARRAVRAALERTLEETLSPTPPSTARLADTILRPDKNRHPPPPPHLRI
jgi:hypothetical protein